MFTQERASEALSTLKGTTDRRVLESRWLWKLFSKHNSVMLLLMATLLLVCHNGKMGIIFSHKWDPRVCTFRKKRTLPYDAKC